MKGCYMLVTATFLTLNSNFAVFGNMLACGTTFIAYAIFFEKGLAFFNGLGSEASTVFKGVRLFMDRTLLIDIRFSSGSLCSVGFRRRRDLRLVRGDYVLELLIFFTALSGFAGVAAEENRVKLGSLRM